jgi:poly(3-hydroxybutyrate) depolymerase
MASAFRAMRQGKPGSARRTGGAPGGRPSHRTVPTIVFHGDRDTTVHPSNGEAVIADAIAATTTRVEMQQGRVPGGHSYRRILRADAGGETVHEQWVIEGAGHAWSGGSPAGSYTDPRGPDATREMMRFFLEHPHPAPGRAT